MSYNIYFSATFLYNPFFFFYWQPGVVVLSWDARWHVSKVQWIYFTHPSWKKPIGNFWKGETHSKMKHEKTSKQVWNIVCVTFEVDLSDSLLPVETVCNTSRLITGVGSDASNASFCTTASRDAPQCLTKLSPESIASKMKTRFPSRKAFNAGFLFLFWYKKGHQVLLQHPC